MRLENWKVKGKILAVSLIAALVPAFTLGAMMLYCSVKVERKIADKINAQINAELATVAENALAMCSMFGEMGKNKTDTEALRKALMQIKIGATGYVYIIQGSGDKKGSYVVSKDGKRDG